MQNALAAAAVALELGLSLEEVQKGLAAFVGVRRRLESHGEIVIAAKRVLLIDDYAHHPTIRPKLKRLWMLYAPLILIVVSCWFFNRIVIVAQKICFRIWSPLFPKLTLCC